MEALLKKWLLPISMVLGIVLHPWLGPARVLIPYMAFLSLFISFCRISPKDLHFQKLHVGMFAAQLGICAVAYFAFLPFDPVVAQGVMVCALISPATVSPVVTAILGGNMVFAVSFLLFSNICVAIAAPLIFSLLQSGADVPFWDSFLTICGRVFPVLVLPLVCAWSVQRFAPKAHGWLVSKSIYAFYLWGFSLTIVVASTTDFILHQDNPDYTVELMLAGGAFVVCCVQFFTGKLIGRLFYDPVSCGQVMGQKNTIVAIWMAMAYISPAASIAPASYVLWQNFFNSWQLWRRQKSEKAERPQSG